VSKLGTESSERQKKKGQRGRRNGLINPGPGGNGAEVYDQDRGGKKTRDSLDDGEKASFHELLKNGWDEKTGMTANSQADRSPNNRREGGGKENILAGPTEAGGGSPGGKALQLRRR